MNQYRLLRLIALAVIILALGLFASVGFAQDEDEEVHWEYEGENGPENWGSLAEDYEVCASGELQSPIDIAIETINYVDAEEFPVIEIDYQPSAINVVNNGHTIQINYDEGSTLTIDDVVYNLLQFHFHTPSEHTIQGQSFPLEMHLVHANEDGELAVLGIIMEVSNGETPTDAFDLIWSQLPTEEGELEIEGEVNAADLLSEDLNILTYSGSLTTPPCSEGVTWILSGQPLVVEQYIVDDFAAIFEFNNRPTQPINDRELTVNN